MSYVLYTSSYFIFIFFTLGVLRVSPEDRRLDPGGGDYDLHTAAAWGGDTAWHFESVAPDKSEINQFVSQPQPNF